MKNKKLNIYFTAGCPSVESTPEILRLLQEAGADRVEIGIPYSDPVADGIIIQKAHQKALDNKMNLHTLFNQLISVKNEIKIPLVLMGYLNTILSFGVEAFCQKCHEAGIAGLILPDLPPYEFEKHYQDIFQKYALQFTFLVTPEDSDERILYLDSLSSGFLYAVSSSATTGNENKAVYNEKYLDRLAGLNLKNEIFVGFGIKNKEDFEKVTEKVAGGIIGTAFVKILLESNQWQKEAKQFVQSIKG